MVNLSTRQTDTNSVPVVTLHFTTCTTVLFSVSLPPVYRSPSLSMPTYHARGITVHLGSMPLAETTTSDVVLKKGEVAKRQSEAVEKKLLRSGCLNEKRVFFPGDRDGFELNWLGNAPFMQVQADGAFAQPSGPYASDQEPRMPEHNRPQALILHVKLSDKAFLSGSNGKTHLKIEVLFNGQLSTCSLIHTNDIRSGAKSLHQIFAGYRVDFLAERPWVLLPPFTTADGGPRRFRKTITPRERWEEVNAAILKEAEERGTDKYGESPPSAALLHALASMEMPECVKAMQKPGGRKFGVVDVVITAGFGNKLTTGANYLKRPQRLKDPNYAVRTEIRSDNEAVAAESDNPQDTTDQLLDEAIPDVANNETNAKECDGHHEGPRKHRALSSVEGLPHYSSPNKTDFQGFPPSMQIPVLPPPIRLTTNTLSPTAGRVSPRCPSPEHRSDGHKEPLPSNDQNRTYDVACEIANAQDWKSDASRIFQEYHSPPSELEMHTLQEDLVNSALTSMPFSDPMTTRAPNCGPPVVDPPSVSSPMPHAFGYHTSPFAQPKFPAHMDTTISTTDLRPSTPFVAPTALMLPIPPNWTTLPPALTLPYYYPMSFQHQAQTSSDSHPPGLSSWVSPNGLPSLMPQTPPLYEQARSAQFTTPIMSSPPLLQACGPLPPTAMFSVPSKPRRGVSPDKGFAPNNLKTSRSSVLISRLLITGLNGKPIVDHVWRFSQRIFLNTRNGGETFVEDRAKAPVPEQEKSHDEYRARKRSNQRNTGSQMNSQAASPIKGPQSEIAEQQIHERRWNSVQDGQLEQVPSVPLPYLKRHQKPANEDMPFNPKIDVPDKIPPFVSRHMLAAPTPTLVPTPVHTVGSASPTQPAASQRRAFSRSVLPGIQGPKATTFLFDDPEEVLREAARMRRSRSPTKPAATTRVQPVASTGHPESTTDQEVQGGSSPLSSVPSSPLLERPADADNIADAAAHQIPQLDGLPEHKFAAISPRKTRTPSPTKPAFAKPKLKPPGPATPQSSMWPNSKKRKASHQSPTKPPRSPDRLKTVGNPPLNGDCVIALAESVDKQEERGVLRQVKGERQGVFKEEYVALAVRFFIAGD